jgi:hypothetical protein
MRRVWVGTVAVAAALAAGCGGGGLAPVRGQLVYTDGTPAKDLAGCSVVFEATAGGKAVGATGEVDEDGRFELTTNKPGDGAPVGVNKVSINPRWRGSSERADPLPVLDKYAAADTSGLTVEVKPGANDVKLTVEPKPARPKK